MKDFGPIVEEVLKRRRWKLKPKHEEDGRIFYALIGEGMVLLVLPEETVSEFLPAADEVFRQREQKALDAIERYT